MAKKNNQKSNGSDSGLNFEAQLWAAADKMRGRANRNALKPPKIAANIRRFFA